MPDKATPFGIYVSVPFCRFKCTYCNFASGVFAAGALDRYLNALSTEIRSAAKSGVSVDSIYLGGGTPSMLSAAQMQSLFGELRRNFRVAEDAEITLEAAPGSITAQDAAVWRACGINRASLGVQSFVEPELKAVGRPHRAATVAADMDTLRTAGIGSINIDLIAGLPHQTPGSWEESLGWIGRLQPDHVSVYILEIDQDSRLGSEVLAGGGRYSASLLPDEDTVAGLYCRAIERLHGMAYRQYEISNFAWPGRESVHNQKYWTLAPYAGFGVDAHSYDGAERWANTDSLDDYLARMEAGQSPVVDRRPVDDRARAEERIFLGLRRNQGVELTAAERDRYEREIARMAQAGLLEFEAGRLRLTDRGRLLSNEVFAEFI